MKKINKCVLRKTKIWQGLPMNQTLKEWRNTERCNKKQLKKTFSGYIDKGSNIRYVAKKYYSKNN